MDDIFVKDNRLENVLKMQEVKPDKIRVTSSSDISVIKNFRIETMLNEKSGEPVYLIQVQIEKGKWLNLSIDCIPALYDNIEDARKVIKDMKAVIRNNIQPCPCGAKGVVRNLQTSGFDNRIVLPYDVTCSKCGFSVGNCKTVEKAIRKWNNYIINNSFI